MDFLNTFLSADFWAMTLVIILFLVGLMGSFLPILPGAVIIWAAIVMHKLWLWDQSVSWWTVGLATGLMAMAILADYLCTLWGARKFGASWKGGFGALIGGVVGLFIPPQVVFIFVGPFLGAVLGELFGGRYPKPALKAGVGTLVGGLIAFAVKLALCVAMVIGFFLSLPPQA